MTAARRFTRTCSAAVLLIGLTMPAMGAAQPDDAGATASGVGGDRAERARQHFRMGVSFFREGDYEAALVEFKRAHTLVPHYKVLFNIGQTFIELHEYAKAVDYLEFYLRRGGDDISTSHRAEVEALIDSQKARVAVLRIRVPESGALVEVDDEVVGTTPIDEPVRLRPGVVRVRVSKEGFTTEERDVELSAGESRAVHVELSPGALVEVAEPSEVSDGELPILIVGASTGAMAVATVVMAVLTTSSEDDLAQERARPTTQARLVSFRDAVETRALLTDVALGLTVVGAVVTSILLVNHLGEAESDSGQANFGVDLSAGRDRATLHIGGRF